MVPRSRIARLSCAGVILLAACRPGPDYAALETKLENGRVEEVEAALAGLESSEAQRLRRQGEEVLERRARVLAELEQVLAQRESMLSQDLLLRLRMLAEGEQDRVLVERLEQELSEALDWAATRPREMDGEASELPGQRLEDTLEARSPSPAYRTSDPLVSELLRALTQVKEAADWRAAFALVERALQDAEEDELVTMLLRQRSLIEAEAKRDGELLLDRLTHMPPDQAASLLRERLADFPPGPVLEGLRQESARLISAANALSPALPTLGQAAAPARDTSEPLVLAASQLSAPVAVQQVPRAEPAPPADRKELPAPAPAQGSDWKVLLENAFDPRTPGRELQMDHLRKLAQNDADTRARLHAAFDEAWQRQLKVLQVRGGWKDLTKLHALRLELDQRRAAALELIRDSVRYFELAPQASRQPGDHGRYQEIQAQVDERVAAVRELWINPQSASIPGSIRKAQQEARWLQAQGLAAGRTLSLPPDLPHWLLVQSATLECLSLADFALDPKDRHRLERDRLILARNEKLWQDNRPQGASRHEQEQVRITNSYRQMLGQPVLAWNSALQEAARSHSKYMAKIGVLTHASSEPGRETFQARILAAGYAAPYSENCYFGSVLPSAAHELWLHSSTHHRNILSPEPTEMASGAAGTFWTQNYGCDRSFEQDLATWHD